VALELIYTSAPRGLRAGASGYCTVAQTRGMREDLVAALERRSLFTHEPKGDSPVYFSYRILSLGGTKWRVLSRGLDAGLDFTGRRHYLIHHLVLEISEDLPEVQPVEILLGWNGWRDSWSGTPVQLEGPRNANIFLHLAKIGLPALEWKRQTGDAGWAASASQMPSPVGWQSEGLSSPKILRLMGESTALMENTRRGGSWLATMDVGGAANPVSKDCLWSGRTHWAGVAPMSGVRSILRIEDCRGKEPKGRAEDIEMARSGQGRAVARIGPATPRISVSETGVPQKARLGREPENRSRWKPLALIGILLASAGAVGFLFFRNLPVSDSQRKESEPAPQNANIPLPAPAALEVHKPSSLETTGQTLAKALWLDGGGEEPIQNLHLIYDKKSLTVRDIDEEIKLMEVSDGDHVGIVRGLSGGSGSIAILLGQDFSRRASKQGTSWSVFVPSSRIGLVYLPDPYQRATERLVPVHGQAPEQILDDIAKNIFLDPDRWSIVIYFPPWNDQQFEPITIAPQESGAVWIDRFKQHQSRVFGMRQAALRKLALSLGVDPEKLEQKIQWSKAELKGAEGLPGFDEFQKIDEHYRKWWSRPTTVDTPGEIFARILSIDGIRAEVQLDTKAIARLIQ
jgi:hypothetical protein